MKCEYCGRFNKDRPDMCKSCGAPLNYTFNEIDDQIFWAQLARRQATMVASAPAIVCSTEMPVNFWRM